MFNTTETIEVMVIVVLGFIAIRYLLKGMTQPPKK